MCGEKELEAAIHAGMGRGSYTRTSESTPAGSTAEDSLAHNISRSVTTSLEAIDPGVVCPGEAVGQGSSRNPTAATLAPDAGS